MLRGVVLQRSGQGIAAVAASEVLCDASNSDALTRALTQLRETLRITGPVVVGMPTTSAILTTISPLIVNPRRAALAIEFELQQQLPFSLAEAAWHYRWLPTSNGHSLKTRSGLRAQGSGQTRHTLSPRRSALSPQRSTAAVAVVMRRSLLEERLACCRRAGLTVHAMAVNEVAILNVVARSGSLPPSAVLLNVIDEQTAEWIVWSPASFQVIPVASPSSEQFLQALVASWETLGAQGMEATKTIRVVGVSQAASSHGLDWARLHDALVSRWGGTVEPLELAQAATGVTRLERPERAVAALGLALQGLGVSPLPLNLLDGVRTQAQAQRIQRVAIITSGVCAVAAVAIGLSGMVEVRRRRATVLRTLERQEHLYQTLRPEVRALLQRQHRTMQQSLQLERLVSDMPFLSQTLAQIADGLPDHVWLTTLECAKTKADAIEGLLKGRAKSFQDVTQFLERLKGMAGVTDVKPLSTSVMADEESKTDIVVFAVQFHRQRSPTP